MNTDLKVAPISRFLIRCSLLLIETFEGADNEEIYRECVFVSAGPMTTLAASVFNVESRKKKKSNWKLLPRGIRGPIIFLVIARTTAQSRSKENFVAGPCG